MVGYNVQSAVDTKHHLIVTHEVTNVGSDRSQLSRMTERARAAIGSETIEAVADRGYYSGEEIVACEHAGITVYLPKPITSGLLAKGRFGKQDFVYVVADDIYLCPAGKQLTYHYTNEEEGKTLRRYWTTACQGCALKSKCTTGKERRISRWEHEAVLEAVQARLDRNPAKMRERRQTVEHPFGTIKSWMGATHFQMKTLKTRYRNGATRPRLQYEKGNQHSGRWWFDGGNPGIGSPHRCQPLPPTSISAFLHRLGQTAKNSQGAYVFRFASELRHCSPRSALRICAKTGNQDAAHSINSSASTCIDCGTASPSVLAVLALMISSNFVGRNTGRSSGLAPRKILPA
jgi:hypothetical protein